MSTFEFAQIRQRSQVWRESLTHWGRMTHICISKLTIMRSDYGLSPERRQAIILTNAALLLIGPLWTNVSEILIKIIFLFEKIRLKVPSAKRRPFCIGLNVLRCSVALDYIYCYMIRCMLTVDSFPMCDRRIYVYSIILSLSNRKYYLFAIVEG